MRIDRASRDLPHRPALARELASGDARAARDARLRLEVVRRIAGTGLGLAGARQIVEQHGGAISVDSRGGFGSTITVRLPLAAGR